MTHDVFISYSSIDRGIADAACFTLESRHIRCWIAPRNVMPGQPYAEALIDGLNQSRLMVLIFSANSNSSPQVIREVERAVNKGIAIIPFRIDFVTPSKSMEYFVSSSHWLDATSPPIERHFQLLGDTVQMMLGGYMPQPAETAIPQLAMPAKPKKMAPLLIALGCVVLIAGVIGGIFLTGAFRRIQPIPPKTSATTQPSTPEPPPPDAGTPPEPPASTATSTGGAFTDDFSNTTTGWPRLSNDTVYSNYDNGEYSLQGKKTGINAIVGNQSAGQFSNMTLESEARLSGGPDTSLYGMIFRMKDGSNYYCFVVSGDGAYFVEKRVGGVFTPLVKKTSSVVVKKSGGTNLLKVICKGTSMEFYVNGSRVAALTDTSFSQGWIGLAVRPNGAPAGARFNSIRATPVQ